MCLKINSELKKKNLEGYIIIDDRDSQNYMYIYLKIRYFETFFDDKITNNKKKISSIFPIGGGGECSSNFIFTISFLSLTSIFTCFQAKFGEDWGFHDIHFSIKYLLREKVRKSTSFCCLKGHGDAQTDDSANLDFFYQISTYFIYNMKRWTFENYGVSK